MTSARRAYATDLTDAEWQLLAPLIPAPKPGGRPPLHDRRELVNAMAYWLRAGCAWRLLPTTYRPGRPSTTTSAAGGTKGSGSRSTMCFTSRSGPARAERPPRARRSWTARASRPPSGGRHGYDGAKKLNGRKRHLLVDTLGLVCKVLVTAADVGDRDGAVALLRRLDRRRFPRLRHGWVDGGYRGPFLDWAQQRRGISFQVVSRSDGGRKPRWLPPGATPAIVSPVRRGAAPVGGGADLCLAGPLPPTEQGLRIPHRHLRGRHLPRHDPAAAAPPHPPMSLFRHPLSL
jgi:transposase